MLQSTKHKIQFSFFFSWYFSKDASKEIVINLKWISDKRRLAWNCIIGSNISPESIEHKPQSDLIQVRVVLNFNFTQVANQFWDQIFEHFSKRRELIVAEYIED